MLAGFVLEAEAVAGAEALHPAEAVFGFFLAVVLCVPGFAGCVRFFDVFSTSPGFLDGAVWV